MDRQHRHDLKHDKFVDEIGAMPQAILDIARDGDVLMCMGAGSIGTVPGRLVEIGGAA